MCSRCALHVMKYLLSRFHSSMHPKMLPENLAPKQLLSGFADDKYSDRHRTIKNRSSLHVTEEEGESSGMIGMFILTCMIHFINVNGVLLLLCCFLILSFVTAGLSLLRRFPFGQLNQTDLSSSAAPHTSLFLPVSRGRVLRASRCVYPDHFVPTLIFTFNALLAVQLNMRKPLTLFPLWSFFFLKNTPNVWVLFFSSDCRTTFQFQKTTRVFHPP